MEKMWTSLHNKPSPDNTDLNEEEVVEAVNVPPPVPPPETVTQRCPKRQVLVELPITDSGRTTENRSRPKKTKSMLLKVHSGDSSQSVIDVFSGPDTTDSNTEKNTVSIHVQNMQVMQDLLYLWNHLATLHSFPDMARAIDRFTAHLIRRSGCCFKQYIPHPRSAFWSS